MVVDCNGNTIVPMQKSKDLFHLSLSSRSHLAELRGEWHRDRVEFIKI